MGTRTSHHLGHRGFPKFPLPIAGKATPCTFSSGPQPTSEASKLRLTTCSLYSPRILSSGLTAYGVPALSMCNYIPVPQRHPIACPRNSYPLLEACFLKGISIDPLSMTRIKVMQTVRAVLCSTCCLVQAYSVVITG